MDLQEKSGKDYQAYSSYQKYGEGPQEAAVRELDRDVVLQEFEVDKDAIMLALKTALREHNYEEAQAFVQKYRGAEKIDENFATLARMVAQGVEQQRKIQQVETILDATADDDYKARIALCNKILKIQPDNEKYMLELNRCREATGLAPVGSNGKASPVPVNVANGIKTGISLYFAVIMIFLELAVSVMQLAVFKNWLGVAVMLVAACIHGFTLIPEYCRHQPAAKLAIRIAFNFVLFLIAILFGFFSFMI